MFAELVRADGATLLTVGLREIRQAKVLSQRALAELSGVSQKTIVDVERGQKRPHPTTIRKLAAALAIAPEALAEQLRMSSPSGESRS
jgi:transcriptional regulator with XRE-family HTH domain